VNFCLPTGCSIFFIETKGQHLLENTKRIRLTRLPKGMHLAVITQEHNTFELIQSGNQKLHPKRNTSIKKLLSEFLTV